MTMECLNPLRPADHRCSLLSDVVLTAATLDDWRALSLLHYRSHRLGGAANLYALRRQGDLLAVIAYTYPAVNLAARNRALADLVARLPRCGRARFWNAHLRTIARVVIDPNWRGLGLAGRLVRETLPLVNVPYVEALAAMAHLHPFFIQAGMTRYEVAQPPEGERLREALATAGLRRQDARTAASLEAAVRAVADPALRPWLLAEIDHWTRGYLGAKTGQLWRPTLPQSCGYIARFLYTTPAYFLWCREEATAMAAPGRGELTPRA